MIDDGEQRVDGMVSAGRKILLDAIEQYRPVAIVAAYSGGNDSVVSTHFAHAEVGADALHCSTQTGCPETACHIRDLCRKRGWTLHEKTAPVYGPPRARPGRPIKFDATTLPAGRWTDGDTAYEEFVLNWGFPGPAIHGRMYQRLKGRSIEAFVREAKRGHKQTVTVMIVSGIRHDESRIRAGYQRALSKVGSQVWVNPFYHATAGDFEAYRQEFGLPRNPIKDRVGISGECNCGAYATEREIERVLTASPTTGTYLLNLQARVQDNGYPWSYWGCRPPQAYLDSKVGQMMLAFNDDAGDWQPMCVGCGKERRIAS